MPTYTDERQTEIEEEERRRQQARDQIAAEQLAEQQRRSKRARSWIGLIGGAAILPSTWFLMPREFMPMPGKFAPLTEPIVAAWPWVVVACYAVGVAFMLWGLRGLATTRRRR